MPRFITPDGRAVYVPGVYTKQIVLASLQGQAPEFLVPVLLGGGWEGRPYNANSRRFSEEPEVTPFVYCGTQSAAQIEYGPDAEVSVGMAYAKRHGLPFAFVSCLSDLVRFEVPVTSTGPIVQFTLYGKKYGAPINHYRLTAPSGTSLVITPVERYTPLTADATGTDRRIYVADNSWLRPGQTVWIGDNNTADATKVIKRIGVEPTADGQDRAYVEFTTTIGGAFALAQYALIYTLSTVSEESPVFANAQDMIDWLNEESQYLGAHKEGTFSNPASVIAVSSATVLKEISAWGTVVPGESPAPTDGDYDDFIALMDASAWDLFVSTALVVPQAFCALTASSTAQGALRDWAQAKRTEGYPISVTAGCAWGDVVIGAGDDTDPVFRARALNSQDFMLCAGGLNKLGSYLSTAPAVWGRRIGAGVGHNLTNDPLIYSSPEVKWDERNSGELTTLTRAGVVTYRLSVGGVPRFVVSEGLSTLQDNAQAWNPTTGQTPLVMQRDIVDLVQRDLRDNFEQLQVGADNVDTDTTAALAQSRCDYYQRRRQILTSYTINRNEVDDSGAGINLDVCIVPIGTVDFIGITLAVLVGDGE